MSVVVFLLVYFMIFMTLQVTFLREANDDAAPSAGVEVGFLSWPLTR